jgi:hypothetical protein
MASPAIWRVEGIVVSTGSGRGVAGAELGFMGRVRMRSRATPRGASAAARSPRYELALASADGFIPFSELATADALGAGGHGVRGSRFSSCPA